MSKEKKNVPSCKSEAQKRFNKNFRSNGIKLIVLFVLLLAMIVVSNYVKFSKSIHV